MTILEVDLIGFEQGDARRRRAVVDGVMRSLATGFVYVEHDLPESELDECYAQLGSFFALPTEDKNRSHAPGTRGQRGYTGLLIETAASRTTPDWKEMLNWGESAPPDSLLARNFPDQYADPVFPEDALPGIGLLLMSFHRRLAELQRRFLQIVATGLGAAPGFFDTMVRGGSSLTRAIHYPPMAAAPKPSRGAGEDPPEESVWAGEHGDINLVTALPRATAPGLQVRTAEGWIDVLPPKGHAVLNTGMMLEHLSNGVLPAGIHRVVAKKENPGERLSVVQFLHPTPDTILAPMPSCIGPDRPARFEAISAALRLDQVLREINLDQSDPTRAD